jgi:hypothetical protein
LTLFHLSIRRLAVRDVVTTGLEVVGGACLGAGAAVLFGYGAALLVAGAVLLAAARGLAS